jgi:hypothetical protein
MKRGTSFVSGERGGERASASFERTVSDLASGSELRLATFPQLSEAGFVLI